MTLTHYCSSLPGTKMWMKFIKPLSPLVCAYVQLCYFQMQSQA